MSKLFKSIIIIFLVLGILPMALAFYIEFSDPTESSLYINRNYFLVNVTSSAPNTTYMYIELFNSSLQHHDGYGVSDSNEAFNQFGSLIDGIYYFNATATDNDTNINITDIRNVTVDLTYPTIGYAEPTDNGTINREYILINVTANDTYLSNISIYIYNSTFENINQTITNQAAFLLNYSNNIIDGQTYYFNATACDMAGNCNSTIETWNVTVAIDTNTAPYINMVMPLNNSYHNVNYTTINITIYDEDLNNMTVELYIDDILNNTSENQTNGTILTYNLTELSEGQHNWTARVNDGIDNSTNEIYYFTIDTLAPSVEIISPQNVTYGNTAVFVNISSDGDNVWFYNGTDNETYTIPTYVIFGEGENTLYAYTNDTAGNFNTTQIKFNVNITNNNPITTLNSPANNSYMNTENVTLNITIYDQDMDNITVYLYEDDMLMSTTENQTNGTEITYEWTTLSEGTHNWTVTLNDGTENSTDGYYYITIDTITPVITFNYPPDNTTSTNSSSITFNITVSELNLENITFNLYNSTGSSMNRTTGNNSEMIISILNLNNETYYYNATAYDKAGHNNITETRNITVNVTTTPIVIPPDDGDDDGGGSRSRSSSGSTYYFPTTNQSSNTSGEASTKIYWSTLPAGNRIITNDKKDIPIDSLSILLNNRIDNRSFIEISSKNANPYDEDIQTKILKYIVINTSIDGSYVEKLDIKFRVDKEWLKNNNISFGDVTLYEYDRSKSRWNPVNTSKTTDDGTYVYYSSTSTRLLSLAIGGLVEQLLEPTVSNISSASSVVENIGGESITLNTAEKKGLFRSIIDAISGDKNSTREKNTTSLTKDTQFLMMAITSSVMMLIIGIVFGVLIYRNISSKKEFELEQAPIHKVKTKKIVSYIEEPASTNKIISTAINPKSESESKPLPSAELYIRKVDQLLLQSEYALDNGKLEDAKKYYVEAKNIYFHSKLDYNQKSKIYDKIMALSNKINKK